MFQKDQVQLEKNRTEPELFRDEIDGNGDRGEGSYQGIKEYGSVVSKKIKIKTIHHRTEVDQEPMERTNHRLKTSPVKNSPLKKSNLNYSQIATEGYKKIKVRRGNYQYPQKSIENKQNYSYSESMYHQSRKTSLNYSQDKKSSLLLSVSQKDEDRISSKSKKKVEFTVYEEKRKSNSKSIDKNKEKSLKKHLSSLYSVPYPCTRNIVIDLFDQKAKLSRPKSRSKDRSISREHNRSSKFQLNKSVNKSQQSLINEQKIQGTLEKLSKFQIFNDYKDKLQIENMLQAFHLAGEHECKWVLLVIDQIFSKMRSASKV